MDVSQWWLYDLVVLAIAILCIWNGVSGGALKSGSSLIIGIVSCIAGVFLSGPVSGMVYDAFLKDTMQSTITKELSNTDITGNIRSELESNGIYLPYDDSQIADMLDGISSDDQYMQQAANMIGIDIDDLKEQIEESIGYAIETNDNIIPQWVSDSVKGSDGKVSISAAAGTASAILRDDYAGASQKIEENYVKPVITGVLKTVIFVLITAIFSAILRTVLIVLPNRKGSIAGKFIGAAFGAAKAAIYLYLMVLLVSSISSMQNGMYPFYSKGTINQTYLFRIFYDMWR